MKWNVQIQMRGLKLKLSTKSVFMSLSFGFQPCVACYNGYEQSVHGPNTLFLTESVRPRGREVLQHSTPERHHCVKAMLHWSDRSNRSMRLNKLECTQAEQAALWRQRLQQCLTAILKA
jgi:hypothetical protein